MDKIDLFFQYLKDYVPFALARFNDGEMKGILNENAWIARNDQQVISSLQKALIEAIQYEQENYYIGMPCGGGCIPLQYSKKADELVRKDYPYKTYAVVLTNRNWFYTIMNIGRFLKNRIIIWVSGEDQIVKNLLPIGINVGAHIKVVNKNTWQDENGYQKIKNFYETFPFKSVVMISCGPTSRILVKKWFEKRKDCTFLDVGSTFDPFTRNIYHPCHGRRIFKCKECHGYYRVR